MKKFKTLVLLLILLGTTSTLFAQGKTGLTYGLVWTMNSPGGEGDEAIMGTGIFMGYPFRIAGKKHQFVIQPDLSISKLHGQLYGVFPESENYNIGANVAFKYSYITQKKRISAGIRSGIEGTAGLFGFTMELDRRITDRLMLGINLNTQMTPGSFAESFVEAKLQLTHRLTLQ